MMFIRKASGFALLEVMLALIVIAVAGFGVYSLYSSSQSSYAHDQAVRQVADISSVYTKLSSSNLTSSVTSPAGFVSLLYNSDQLPSTYFDALGANLVNPYGTITISLANPSLVNIIVPLNTINTAARNGFCKELARFVSSCSSTGSVSSVTVQLSSGS